MINTFQFHICCPEIVTVSEFLAPLLRAAVSNVQRMLAAYMSELSLLMLNMFRYHPSQIAAAAMLCSNELVGCQPVWPTNFTQHSPYQEHEIRECADELHKFRRARQAITLFRLNDDYTVSLEKKFYLASRD